MVSLSSDLKKRLVVYVEKTYHGSTPKILRDAYLGAIDKGDSVVLRRLLGAMVVNLDYLRGKFRKEWDELNSLVEELKRELI